MEKILFLGGTLQQIPAIQYAKECGYYTILCDYEPETPGRNYADEYYCVSTTDKEGILDIAKKTNINGIVAYISDTAAPTAAYVANQLNLPSNPYESVNILTRKDLFRKFLKENGFNSPKSESYKDVIEAMKTLGDFDFPIMTKPVDSSGSRGITRIDSIEQFEQAFELARAHSRAKTVIVEEFIEMTHDYQIGGDVFIVDGKLEFCGFLNCYRNKKVNPNAPIGKSYPLLLDEERSAMVQAELERLIRVLKLKTGALNIEVIIGPNNKVYFIDIGPRNGGNLIPDFLKMITGIDFTKATVEAALDHDLHFDFKQKEGFYLTYTIHSAKQGKLEDIIFSDVIKKNIAIQFIYKGKGAEIEKFTDGTKALGYVFFKFGSLEELKDKMNDIHEHIKVQVG